MFLDFSELEAGSSIFQKIFYLVTGMGHQAVMVFFVLSGFFVGGSVLSKRRKRKFSWMNYLIVRLSRLWVVLIPALFITAVIDMTLTVQFSEIFTGSYHLAWNSGPSPDAAYSRNAATFIGNLLFLQTIVFPVFGTNGPLWSLANEFWYYIIFPLCAILFDFNSSKRDLPLTLRVLSGCAAVFLFFLFPNIQQGFFIWLLGLVVYKFVNRVPRIVNRYLLVVGTILFGSALAYSWLNPISWLPSDFAVGLGFCVFCIALTNLSVSKDYLWPKLINVARGLSDISYSLYLIHFPIVLLIEAHFYGFNQLQPSTIAIFQFLIWLGFLILIGATFWWLFERRTFEIRNSIVQLLPILNQ